MNSRFNRALIILAVVIIFTISKGNLLKFELNYRLLCSGSSNKGTSKPPVIWYYRSGLVDSQPYHTRDVIRTRDCNYGCLNDPDCELAEYARRNVPGPNNSSECSYFNSTQLKIVPGISHKVVIIYYPCSNSSWEVCGSDKNSLIDLGRISSNRCPGLWEEYINYKFDAISKLSYSAVKNIKKLDEAFKACLESMECDAINYEMHQSNETPISFEFLRTWPANMTFLNSINSKKENKISIAYRWKCGNCTENLSPDWKPESYSIHPDENDRYLSVFYTLSAESCRLECEQINKHFLSRTHHINLCQNVFYNNVTKVCLVKDNTYATPCSYSLKEKPEYNIWNMISYNLTGKIIDREKSKVDEKCICLTKSRVVYYDSCGTPAYTHNFILCKGTALYSASDKTRNSRGFYQRKMFTGLEYIWAHYDNDTDNDNPCPNGEYCQVFNADLYTPNDNSVKLIENDTWGSQPKYGLIPFTKPRNSVILQSTLWPPCGCYTMESCSHAMRSRQSMFINDVGDGDISENFVIGDDGRIYVGRGWDNQSQSYFSYRENTIVIGLVGDFAERSPSLSAINSLKAFLRDCVKTGKLPSDFTIRESGITEESQLRSFYYLDIIFVLWPNYYGRVQIDKEFCHLKEFIAKMSVIVIAIFITLSLTLSYLIKIDYFHLPSCKKNRKTILEKESVKSCELIWSSCAKENNEFQGRPKIINRTTLRNRFSLNLIGSLCLTIHVKSPLMDCNCCLQLDKLCSYLNNTEQYEELLNALNTIIIEGFLFYCKMATYLFHLVSNELGERSQIIFIHSNDEAKVQSVVNQILEGQFCSCRRLRVFVMADGNDLSSSQTTAGDSYSDIREEVQIVKHERPYFNKFQLIVDKKGKVRSWDVVMAG